MTDNVVDVIAITKTMNTLGFTYVTVAYATNIEETAHFITVPGILARPETRHSMQIHFSVRVKLYDKLTSRPT